MELPQRLFRNRNYLIPNPFFPLTPNPFFPYSLDILLLQGRVVYTEVIQIPFEGDGVMKIRGADDGLDPREIKCALGRLALLAVEVSRDRAVCLVDHRDVLPDVLVAQALHHDGP